MMKILREGLTFMLFIIINKYQNIYTKGNKQIIKTQPQYYHNNQHKYYT